MPDRDEEEVSIALWLPAEFPMSDLMQTCGKLSDSGVCVPGYLFASFEQYLRSIAKLLINFRHGSIR